MQTIADAMGLSLEDAADGILRIVNENMAGALRVISVQRGHDPREFALVAFGGAGPLHANAVAELMGSFPVIVPPSPGLLCALGDLVAGFRNEFAQTLIRLTAEVRRRAARDPRRARGARARVDGRAGDRRRTTQHVEFVADMRYRGQGYEIPVPWERRASRSASTPCTSSSTASGCRTRRRRSSTCARSAPATGRSPSCPRRSRAAESLRRRAPTPAPTCTRARRIAGPSIVTEFDSTTVVLEGYTAEIDRFFNLLIRPEAS